MKQQTSILSKAVVLPLLVTFLLWHPFDAAAQIRTFEAGTLIIPMDIDYQDEGMLRAFGLVYQLLLNDINVYWIINQQKEIGGVDFSASAIDVADETVIGNHGYRGGPFVVDASEAEAALPIVESWQVEHITAVHRTTASFVGHVSKRMTVAPTIAMFADGNEDIAFDYLNAAGIPDSLGQAWPDARDNSGEYDGFPDVLNIEEVRGPTVESNADGALFDETGLPVFCQLMTMHWGVADRDEGAIAEVREFLHYPTHFFAECQAVNAIENAENGHFLTPHGYVMDDRPTEVEFHNVHLPFVQLDGPFQTVGGSEPSYSLPVGDGYFDQGVVMITEAGSPSGERDVWMTGYLDGECVIDPKEGDLVCNGEVGKVSYLGGHRYSTDTPISEHPNSQGTRLFLNSLFEADCVTDVGQPRFEVELIAPGWTSTPGFDFQIVITNDGMGVAQNLVLSDPLPAGMSLVEASPAHDSVEDGTVVWELGTFGPERATTITVTVALAVQSVYSNSARLEFKVGQNVRQVTSNVATTTYGTEPPDQGDEPTGDPAADAGEMTDGTDTIDNLDAADASGDGETPDTSEATDAPVTDDDQPDRADSGDSADGAGEGAGDASTNDPGNSSGAPEEDCGCTQTGRGDLLPLLGLLGLMILATTRRRGNPKPGDGNR